MTHLLTILIFLELHVTFYIHYYMYGVTVHQYLNVQTSYRYSPYVAESSLMFMLLCFAALMAGLQTRHRRTLVAVEMNDRRLRWVFRIFAVASIFASSFLIVTSLGSTYGDYVQTTYKYSFLHNMRIMALVPLCFLLYGKTDMRRVDVALIVIVGLVTLASRTRSNIVEYIFVLLFAYVIRVRQTINVRTILLLVALLLLVNVVAIIRQNPNLQALEGQNEHLLTSEYRQFAPTLVSEVMARFDQRPQCGATILNLSSLFIPSFVRDLFDIRNPDIECLTRIGKEAFPHYGGGFSMLAELYLNFHWWGVVALFFFGLLIKRSWTLLVQARQRGLVSIHVVFPLTFVTLQFAYRNALGIHIKSLVQLYLIAFVLAWFCSRRLAVATVSDPGPAPATPPDRMRPPVPASP
jgi:hypothetical protein